MNIFRVVGDFSHVLSFIIIFYKLWKTKSCAGISGKSQILFAIVFTARYLDLATVFISNYNTSMKLLFLTSSYSILYLVHIKFRASYNRDQDTFYNEFLILPAVTLALLVNYANNVLEILWTFSEYLEAVAILPQLFLARKSKEAESFTTHYLIALTAYRTFYMQNWIYRFYVQGHYDLISICAATVQLAIYLMYFIYLFILKDCCISGPETENRQGDIDDRQKGKLLQSNLAALHLDLAKDHPYTLQLDSKVLHV